MQKSKIEYVRDDRGRLVDYAAAVNLMDNEIREALHLELAPCTSQKFFDEYCKAHRAKYGAEFEVM